MKRTILFISCITFILGSTWQNIDSPNPTSSQLNVIFSDIETSRIEFSIEGFHLIPVETHLGIMYRATLNDGASLLEEGSPDVHKYSRSIIIPDQAKMEVKVISSEFVEYRDILVAPSKGNLSRLVDPKDVSFQFGDAYQDDAYFPRNIAELGDPYILRDLRGQTVVFNPIQYNPVQKVLRVYNRVLVEVTSSGKSNNNVLSRVNNDDVKYPKEFLNIYKNHFLNFNTDSRFDYLIDHGNMLIISYGSFMDDMQELVDWKNRKGIPTEMVNVSDVGSNSSAIETYVSNYYNNNGLTFLLLVGDIAQIPSPSISGSASDPSYGFISGNDSYAEVIVGRFSGSNSTQISTQVERSIEYERDPQGGADWYDNALGIASNQGPGFNGFDDDEFNEYLWNTVLSPFTYDSYEGIYDPSGTDQQGVTAINNGVSLINYTGHGSISSWGNGASLNTSQINSLENDNLLPFVITVGCNVGEFQSTNACFCEAWQRATHNGEPTGSICHYGSTISQSWEPPMHGQYAMNLILTESYDEHLTRTIGGIATNGCMYMNDAQGSSGVNETNYWTMFGDPSIPIRTAPPTVINAEYNDVIILGANTFSAYTGTEGDLVALSRDGELLSSGYTDPSGVAYLELGSASSVPGELDLVMYDQDILVFVEVKHRATTRHGHPLEMVNAQKRRRLIRAASLYIARHNLSCPCRFDILAITGTPPTLEFHWEQAAFDAY